MLWMLFRRPWEPSAEKVQQLLTYCLLIGGLGAPYWRPRGSQGGLRDVFCLQLGTQGQQKDTQGVVMGPTENCNIPRVFEVLGAWELPVGIIWTHMDATWTPMELIGGRMVLLVAIVGL